MTIREALQIVFQRTGAEFLQLRFGRPGSDGWISRAEIMNPGRFQRPGAKGSRKSSGIRPESSGERRSRCGEPGAAGRRNPQ